MPRVRVTVVTAVWSPRRMRLRARFSCGKPARSRSPARRAARVDVGELLRLQW